MLMHNYLRHPPPSTSIAKAIHTESNVVSKGSVPNDKNAYARTYVKKREVLATDPLCPNHPLCEDSLIEVHKPTGSHYQYDYLLCSGFDLLKPCLQGLCSRSKVPIKNEVFACSLCYTLPKGDKSRFFFCGYCNGKYHQREMIKTPPPTRGARSKRAKGNRGK